MPLYLNPLEIIMSRERLYNDQFTHDRRRAWLRGRCQAVYREEGWDISFEDFCAIWHKSELFYRRGTGRDSVVLTRRDIELPWSRINCVIVTKLTQMKIRSAIQHHKSWQHFLEEVE